MDFFSPRAARSPDHINVIKAQVVAALRLLEEATVMVTELACTEEGCLPVETVIAIFQTATQKIQFKIHRSLSEITMREIQEMCAQQRNSSLEKKHGNSSN